METENILRDAQINERFIDEYGEQLTFMGLRGGDWNFKYILRDEQGETRFYNASGKGYANLLPKIVLKRRPRPVAYAEVPVIR